MHVICKQKLNGLEAKQRWNARR